ncbi:MAG: alpha-amylase family glycosyl hydrolase [Candidatus Amulumruptor caecigallinarius]|nr:alpha-amylase family glycosyl hydrolase [Candidatus Amulumruptor caecigallinarius]
MKKFRLLSLLAALLCIPAIRAQVTTEPSPLQEDSQNVVIYFHADEGDKGMMGLTQSTAVYAHTGVEVVDANGNKTEWKYAPSWEVNSEKYQLSYVSENLWKLEIGDIRTYYGVADNETVKKLCFVFRNANGSKTGRAQGGGDIFVDVLDSGLQLAFRSSPIGPIVKPGRTYTFTATATEAANLSIYVNNTLIGESEGVTELKAQYEFPAVGDYLIKAVAKKGSITRERTLDFVYANDSQAATDQTVPPMGVTKNSDGTYTFCFCAPNKNTVILEGSWNNFKPANNQVMSYVDQEIDGGTFRFFKITLPASVTGTEFQYIYLIDGATTVGDPYALLCLDPYNDKYISADVFPNIPAYPENLSGTLVSWYGDDLLKYDWTCTDFEAPDQKDLVIYELLFRDFTGTEGAARGNGTVRQAIEKIPYLKSLGVNVIELLPINEFNGNNSWGYNPNLYFAADKAYGTPRDYKEFIDLCHQNGMAVVLDVVFNQSDGLHPWYQMYNYTNNPFYNRTAPHAFSVLNDWNQGNPMVERQWKDMLKFWLSEYKVDGFRFDLVKGLGDNDSYLNATDGATNAYNASRVARMKRLHDAMREVNPKAYFINENLAGPKEENEMAADGELNWANVNDSGCQFAMGYQSNSSLIRMNAKYDSRTAFSTVAYLESHDEQRLAYKQDEWGVAGVKGNHKVSMQRLGSAASQMILVPGAHMIWMFSEMGNAQNTKSNSGNNTSPKIVNWALLEDPDNAALMQNYSEMIAIRLANPDLFGENATYRNMTGTWQTGRYITAVNGNKELYVAINPLVEGNVTITIPFKSDDNNAYQIGSKSYQSNPSFDAAAKTVTVEPNCYVVIATKDALSGVDDITIDNAKDVSIYSGNGCINVANSKASVNVYSIDGALAGSAAASEMVSIPVSSGIYVVKAGEKVSKIIVR